MDGEGVGSLDQRQATGSPFDVPAVLAQLDRRDPAEQRVAVETIRETIADEPRACVPTVPKLRALLEQDPLEYHETVAYCLAELAAEFPADVAPSVEELVTFAGEHPTASATGEVLRCLEAVAREQPATVSDYVASIADVIDERPGYDEWGLRLVRHVSHSNPVATTRAVPVLLDALEADPEATGTQILPVFGRLARAGQLAPACESNANDSSFESLLEETTPLLDHDVDALRRNAIGCLADVATHSPTAVTPPSPALVGALDSTDPQTRANAAVVFARVAMETNVIPENARDPLIGALATDHERVRSNACVALGYGRVETASDRLETLAHDDPEPSVRERAEWALERLS
ncbi:HEAT repeat domain-containing protein [Natronorubrum daqingense]|uniref:HEAT repeat-containing protein n=1 Tax=Natronorubrum daqingense TaxID=588898 RepID=A0A1N6XGN7_9EURY|nr:HEAT repeat domain-containing protein [Natronorubrum daqingense]APX95957.1 hypothetical protein BB347_04610 [Natronorubrum daqingense]SIR01514.1 HEAT repeat-containing protein [Natronorubrum daqingense]